MLTGERWRLSYELREQPVSADRPEPSAHSEERWVARFMDEFDAEEVTDEAESAPPGGEGAQDDERGAKAVTSNEKGT